MDTIIIKVMTLIWDIQKVYHQIPHEFDVLYLLYLTNCVRVSSVEVQVSTGLPQGQGCWV